MNEMAQQQTWQWSTRVAVLAHESEGMLYGVLKRCVDVVFCAALLIVLLPVLLFIALLIKLDRKSTRLNSSHEWISYAVFCLKKKKHSDGLARAHPPLHGDRRRA